MSKRALQRLAMSICFMLCVMILGQVTVFANEVNPIHEYNFDSDEGTSVYDSIKDNAIDGTAFGRNSSSFVTGYNGTGKARVFKGREDYIKIDKGVVLIKGDGRSIRFKIKKDPSTLGQYSEPIISTAGSNGTASIIALNSTGILYMSNGSGGFGIKTPESVCDGQWHDILFTFDNTGIKEIKFYVDDMTTPVAIGKATPNGSVVNEGPLMIGSTLIENQKWDYFNGYLDDIQIYNVVITPETSTPVTPLNLKATAGNSKIDLTWDAADKATSYTVKRATTAGGPYTTIATDITETSYTDTDVTSGTTYYYIVSAINAGAEIGNSNEASAQSTESQTPPTTDSKLKVVLEVAESLRLSVDDDLNVNTQMSWSSSEPTVATVNEKGIVTALTPGNTVITVKSADGSYTDYINVLVVENADDYRLAIDLKVGETARLTADDFTNTANITWAPMDSSIANVTTKGKVTALSKGLVLISAKDAEGNIIGRVYVRVRE